MVRPNLPAVLTPWQYEIKQNRSTTRNKRRNNK